MLGATTSDRETRMRLPHIFRPTRFQSILLAGLLGAVAPPARGAATVTFDIADATDPAEVTEATTVFINGKQVAHFELSAEHPYDVVRVTVPEAQHYDYALCGRITVRAEDGHSETHVLDDGATLDDPSGHHLEALAMDGFTTFYLGERGGNLGAAAPHDLHRTNVCSIPLS
jgi:hypothetical protein